MGHSELCHSGILTRSLQAVEGQEEGSQLITAPYGVLSTGLAALSQATPLILPTACTGEVAEALRGYIRDTRRKPGG